MSTRSRIKAGTVIPLEQQGVNQQNPTVKKVQTVVIEHPRLISVCQHQQNNEMQPVPSGCGMLDTTVGIRFFLKKGFTMKPRSKEY